MAIMVEVDATAKLWMITPLYGLILSVIMFSLVLLGLIWLPKFGKLNEKSTCPFIALFRGIIFTVFAYYGILLVDTAVKVAFFGALGFGNFQYHIAAVILLGIFGIMTIIGAVFVAPTWRTIITFGGILSYSLYLIEYKYAVGFIDEKFALYMPLIVFILIAAGIWVVGVVVNFKLKRPALESTPLWDFSPKFKKLIQPKILLVYWVLLWAEFMLEFEGLALLYWY